METCLAVVWRASACSLLWCAQDSWAPRTSVLGRQRVHKQCGTFWNCQAVTGPLLPVSAFSNRRGISPSRVLLFTVLSGPESVLVCLSFLWCWGLNPRFHTCWVSAGPWLCPRHSYSGRRGQGGEALRLDLDVALPGPQGGSVTPTPWRGGPLADDMEEARGTAC